MAKHKYKRRLGMKPVQGAGQPLVRLSQCMIVKNEERNIEKALSWGKGIVCEQIVVDTGSTDRTVEIAESMGAKVLHFEWINDFAAAKNFAIEQASGNWIAFLDADEYIIEEEARLVVPLLELVMTDPKRRRNDKAVCCPWIQLNDKGVPKEVYEQERIFQNLPDVRYAGIIHESLSLTGKDVVYTNDFRIMHTGYTEESFIKTGKAQRNVELLRKRLAENPDDLMLKAYLAESLRAEAAVRLEEETDKEKAAQINAGYTDEVLSLYNDVLDSGINVPGLLKKSTYEFFIERYLDKTVPEPKNDRLCLDAYKEFPNDPKFMCYYAMSLNKNKKYNEALEVLKKCEAHLEKTMGSNPALTTKVMGLLSAQMVLSAQALGDIPAVIRYAEIMLIMNKNNLNILRPYIYTVAGQGASIDDMMGMLGRVYDLSSKRDLFTIARAATDCGVIALARRIVDVASYLGDS